jgi:hypothetical protein
MNSITMNKVNEVFIIFKSASSIREFKGQEKIDLGLRF